MALAYWHALSTTNSEISNVVYYNCNIVAVFKNFSEVCIAHLLYISRRAYKLVHPDPVWAVALIINHKHSHACAILTGTRAVYLYAAHFINMLTDLTAGLLGNQIGHGLVVFLPSFDNI